MIYTIAGIVVAALALLAVGIRKAVTSAREKRESEWALKKFQLEVITEAAKKTAAIAKEAEIERAKLADMSNVELEKLVNK